MDYERLVTEGVDWPLYNLGSSTMRQSVTDMPKLLPFGVSLDDLRTLTLSLRRHFPDNANPHFEIKQGSQSFSADDVEELRSLSVLPNHVHDFSVSVSSWKDDKRFYLSADAAHLYCRIEGPDGAWCASIRHEVDTFIMQHRRWFWSVRKYRLGVVLLIAYFIVLSTSPLMGFVHGKNIVLVGYLLMMVAANLLIFKWWDKLFPWAILTIREEPLWIKRYKDEIATIGVLISILFGLVSLILGRLH